MNVGGELFTTKLETLVSISNTYFTTMFEGEYQLETDSNGNIFIDRDPELFGIILCLLRNQCSSDSISGLAKLPNYKLALLKLELCFYGLNFIVDELDKLEKQKIVVISNKTTPIPEGARIVFMRVDSPTKPPSANNVIGTRFTGSISLNNISITNIGQEEITEGLVLPELSMGDIGRRLLIVNQGTTSWQFNCSTISGRITKERSIEFVWTGNEWMVCHVIG